MAPPALRLAIHAVGSRCRRGKSTKAHLAWSLAPAIADPRGAPWPHRPGRSSTEQACQRNAPRKRALGLAQGFRASFRYGRGGGGGVGGGREARRGQRGGGRRRGGGGGG